MSRRPLLATYRLQFAPDFTFDQARELVPYLAQLGISHVYASPILASRPGSTHGYDGIDPTRIDEELGGEAAFRAFAAELAAADLGLILDIVPNHLAAHYDNPWWSEILEFGRSAPNAAVFDVDWNRERLDLPFLAGPLKDQLREGAIRLASDPAAGRLVAVHHDTRWPLRPETVADLLQPIATAAADAELAETANLFRGLAEADPTPERIAEAHRRLAATLASPRGAAIEAALAEVDLDTVLERQHWRATDWRKAAEDLAHRRFFNITELVGVRVEDEAVFEAVHALPVALLREGLADGLRIDHIDGLADPQAYCRRLRAAVGPDVWIFVEKILGEDEDLRDWPIDGTTGYERLNLIGSLFVPPDGYAALARYTERHGMIVGDVEARTAAAKREIVEKSFGSELAQLVEVARRAWGDAAPPTASDMREALLALLAHMPIYRTYVADRPAAEDRSVFDATRAAIRRSGDDRLLAIAERLVAVMLDGDKTPGSPAAELTRRFQQLSGPAMAKGFEDTEIYRNVVLGAVNEVGGSLARPWREPAEIHRAMARRANARATDLTPLATHDTKRGPETRARLCALAGHVDRYLPLVEGWTSRHAGLRSSVDGRPAPDPLDAWIIYQTLLAVWPASKERLHGYFTKAMREAKRHTGWEAPNEAYEAALIAFVDKLADGAEGAGFRRDVETLLTTIRLEGRIIGLAQTVLQLTLPGTPDIYRGTELWDDSLVDPDNRRPVDWALLREAYAGEPRGALADDAVGFSKFHVTRTLLRLRRADPDLFLAGDYIPLALPASAAGWFGYLRRHDTTTLLVVVPTRPNGLAADPTGLRLPPATNGNWHGVTGAADMTVDRDGSLHPAPDRNLPFVVALRRGSGSPREVV